MSRLSIIVPVYNTEKYLRKCLESIMRQTFSDFEVIVVDDGSTDSSSSICDEYALLDPRIRVIHKNNEGLVSARKAGLAAASGSLIAYVDSDDWIESDAYSYMITAMEQNDCDLVVCDRYVDTKNASSEMHNGIAPGIYNRSAIENEILPHIIGDGSFFRWNIYPSLWDKLFKREKLLNYQFSVDNQICEGEDAAVSVPYIADCNKILFSKSCFYHYVQHDNSMVKKKHDPKRDRIKYKILYYSLMHSLIKNPVDDNLYREQIEDYIRVIAVPRISGLMRSYENEKYLLPFTNVKKSERIYLYGAGVFGFNMYNFLKETDFCHLLGIMDRNYEAVRSDWIKVMNPVLIKDVDASKYDHIVVTVMDQDAQNAIKNTLISYGVDADLISVPDMSFIDQWCIWEE